MGVQITSRVLPGIGVCHEISLHDGRRVDIVTRHNGIRDVVLYDEADDGPGTTISVDDDEADALAEVLGSPTMVKRLARRQKDADALLTEQLPIAHNSPFARRSLGDTRARSKTGASIVAVLRGGVTHLSPGPDFMFEGGDLVVTVGTREGLDQVGRILEGTG
jgi:TrkA domain protein